MGTSRYDAMSDGQLESVTGCGIKEYGIEFGKAMKVAVKAGIFWTEVSACLWLQGDILMNETIDIQINDSYLEDVKGGVVLPLWGVFLVGVGTKIVALALYDFATGVWEGYHSA